MGGFTSEVSETTKNVLIETAHFDGISVARTARRHKLFSEASKRYERGVDPRIGELASARVIQLLELHAGGKAGTLGATFSDFEPAKEILLPNGFASELMGVDYSQQEIEKVLRDIGSEVSADKAAELGVQWAALSGDSGSPYRVGVLSGFSSEGNNLVTQAASLLGPNKSALPPGNGLTMGLFRQHNGTLGLGLLARALERDVKANILSMPNLITLDNEEARIIVGQNVPFITGQFTTPASGGTAGVNPFQTIERRDIGLSLRVRPQISEGGTVKMAIYQETSNIQQSTTSGLITSKRSIDTNVLVDDGQIIVLGGLIEDTVNDSVEKVPGLGSIPILGYLFRYQSRRRGKTNLMVFLRPTVIRTDAHAVAVASDRYDYIRGTQSEIKPEPNALLPPIDTPSLPALKDGKPVGGSFLRRHDDPTSPPPANPSSRAPSETFPVEPPVIDLR
jgi:general secretion pathway protein D